MKIGDRVQVWNEKEIICLGQGEVVGIGVGCKKDIPLVELEDGLIWIEDNYHCFPEEKIFRIVKRIEEDLKDS